MTPDKDNNKHIYFNYIQIFQYTVFITYLYSIKMNSKILYARVFNNYKYIHILCNIF